MSPQADGDVMVATIALEDYYQSLEIPFVEPPLKKNHPTQRIRVPRAT